jgi:diaminohydroxyphosphoribosylaminopyrimidine deaminase / 5-amino-6-(5-phosphoribosylamino)uracil reductase
MISGVTAQRLVHKWRSEEDAILVGARTAALDNPLLNTRFGFGKSPLRVIIDPRGNLDPDLKIFDRSQKTLIITSNKSKCKEPGYICSPTIIPEPEWILEQLYLMNIQSVIVEGGSKTLAAFINSGLWDEARIFKSAALLGGGTAAPVISGKQVLSTNVGPDKLVILEPL